MISSYAFSGLINAIVSLLFGLVVYFGNKKAELNKKFVVMCSVVFVWSFSYFLWQIADNAQAALFWSRALMAGAIFIPVTYFHFVITFLNKYKENKKLLIFVYILSFIFLILNFTPLFVNRVEPILFFPFWPKAGITYGPFVFMFVVLGIYCWYLMFKSLKKSAGIERIQIKYVFIGTLIGYSAGISNYFLWYNIPILPLGNWICSIYIISMAYAVLKHHLMNIKVIATELVGGALILVFLFNIFLSQTSGEILTNLILFIFVFIFGVLLIRGVLQEVKTREQMEKLAGDLEIANERLRELNERLKKLDKIKSEFVSIASHQLRTPITAIKGYTSMILEGTYGPIPEKIKPPLERVFESSNRLVHMITDYLTVSRIERGKIEYDFKKADFKGLVTSVFDEFKAVNVKEKKGLDLSLDIAEKGDYTFAFDQEKIRQVIYNIIENAMKYTPKGFIKVFLSKTPDKKQVIFKVQDSGIGINRESLQKLFQKFSQAGDKNQAGAIIGVGLGLYVAKEIIQAHRGEIRAESRGEGKGSAFYVELPVNFKPLENNHKLNNSRG